MILADRSTTDPIPDQVEDLTTADVLTHSELGNDLPTKSCARVLLNRDVKAAFSIDESRYVRIQPFLLIGRTCRIVTAPVVHGPRAYVSGVMATTFRGRVAQDAPAIPAFSQVYRQRGSFTVSRRSKPRSRTALMGEQPNPWDRLQPQDATSRHRGAKPSRRYGLLGKISLLSPGYLLSVERRRFHKPPPDH